VENEKTATDARAFGATVHTYVVDVADRNLVEETAKKVSMYMIRVFRCLVYSWVWGGSSDRRFTKILNRLKKRLEMLPFFSTTPVLLRSEISSPFLLKTLKKLFK
jgi:hypothetical protein